MSSTYHLHTDALDADFLASVKTLYKNRNLTITVEAEMDETDRILANPAMKAKLDAALADDENLVELNLSTFEDFQASVRSGGVLAIEYAS
jgi:murein endopeptidase